MAGAERIGGCCLFVQGSKLSDSKNAKIKHVVDLDGLVRIFQMQQSAKIMWVQWSEYVKAGFTRGELAGGMKPSFLGALEVERR